jgi:RNA polymerase sigma factor (TIGR02999 family)
MSYIFTSAGSSTDAAQLHDVTTLLHGWSSGANPTALNQLMPLVYHELRKIAASHFRRETPGHTLQSTALVHEAYLKLVDQHRVQWHDRGHFFAVAAQIIRRILVTHSRKRKAAKRGGGEQTLLYDDAIGIPKRVDVDLIALDEAMADLAKIDSRQARIVELRFFGGLSVEATADFLGISPATVKRDWVFAKAWLFRQLSRGEK